MATFVAEHISRYDIQNHARHSTAPAYHDGCVVPNLTCHVMQKIDQTENRSNCQRKWYNNSCAQSKIFPQQLLDHLFSQSTLPKRYWSLSMSKAIINASTKVRGDSSANSAKQSPNRFARRSKLHLFGYPLCMIVTCSQREEREDATPSK